MDQVLGSLESWWAADPWLTAIGLVAAVILTVLFVLIPLALLCLPSARILFRAFCRLVRTKIGEGPQGLSLPKQYKAHLEEKRIPRLLMTAAAAAFGRNGVVYLTSEEIGFVASRFGMITEKNLPYAQISEAKIHKGWLFDYVTVTTRDRAETIRLYRSDRDLGQEFFNHLQMRLGAMRFRKS